jgi:membrane carboxypeptidase/penicillin-binding protein PbpC
MYKGGLQVTTSLDPNVQAIAEEEAKKQIEQLRSKNVSNAAVVIMNPHTGEILAMVGSVDFSNKEISGQVNVADRPRQPGSSIKPINYVTAFKHGWTPATPIYDLKTNFPDGNGRPPYVPVDYDGKERGSISARTALASSLNIPAVKALYSTSTLDVNKFPQPLAMIDTARKLGLTTFTDANGNPKQTYGLALTLGGGEVTLVELTDVYAAFANQGARIPATPYSKIVDGHGRVIFDVNGKNKPVAQCAQFSPGAPDEKPDATGNCTRSAPYAYLISSILSDNDARTAGFGPDSVLKLSRPAAVKTGTTNDFRDNWTIGYTSDLVVGVWVGNSNNVPMQNVSGVTGAAPIWHNIMERAFTLLNLPSRELPVPGGLVRAVICIDSGLLATDQCPANRRREEIFVAGHAPTEKDNVWVQTSCVGLAQVPPHDVGDLIPYHQILNWARSKGWNVPPGGDAACNGAQSVTQGGQNPNPAPAQNKDKKKDKKKKH